MVYTQPPNGFYHTHVMYGANSIKQMSEGLNKFAAIKFKLWIRLLLNYLFMCSPEFQQ